MQMLDLEANKIHLWFVFLDEVEDGQLLDRYRELLTPEERIQEKRFYFQKDQLRYLVTRALVRTVLSRYAPISPVQWTFFPNAYGKPEISNDDFTAKNLSFNISHTDGLIVLGITTGSALGIDTENVRTRHAPLEIGGHFFAPEEVSALDELPLENQPDRFFQYWTLKEAYIKARGMGLSIPLNQFAFQFPQDGQVAMTMWPQLSDTAARWRFRQYRVAPDFLLAVCVERSTESDLCFVMKKVIPMAIETDFSCELFRVSSD